MLSSSETQLQAETTSSMVYSNSNNKRKESNWSDLSMVPMESFRIIYSRLLRNRLLHIGILVATIILDTLNSILMKISIMRLWQWPAKSTVSQAWYSSVPLTPYLMQQICPSTSSPIRSTLTSLSARQLLMETSDMV